MHTVSSEFLCWCYSATRPKRIHRYLKNIARKEWFWPPNTKSCVESAYNCVCHPCCCLQGLVGNRPKHGAGGRNGVLILRKIKSFVENHEGKYVWASKKSTWRDHPCGSCEGSLLRKLLEAALKAFTIHRKPQGRCFSGEPLASSWKMQVGENTENNKQAKPRRSKLKIVIFLFFSL